MNSITPMDELSAILTGEERVLGDETCGPMILVDFDHTLFASNSTELFLATASPSWIASLILGFVRGVLPWHLYDPRRIRLRDYLSIVAIIVAMPWTFALWRRRCPQSCC